MTRWNISKWEVDTWHKAQCLKNCNDMTNTELAYRWKVAPKPKTTSTAYSLEGRTLVIFSTSPFDNKFEAWKSCRSEVFLFPTFLEPLHLSKLKVRGLWLGQYDLTCSQPFCPSKLKTEGLVARLI